MQKTLKICVLGGTGYAGSAITREAVKRGHHVTVISRKTPDDSIPGVNYFPLNIDESELKLDNVDVIVGALSPRAENAGTLARNYKKVAVQAAKSGTRLVLVGGFSCLRRAEGSPRMLEDENFPTDTPPEIIAEAQENLDVLNDLISDSSGLDWLFVSPAMEFSAWMPGTDRGHYRKGGEVALFDADGKSSISGIDYARAILDEIETPVHHRAQIGVAY
ncbi:NAD(P)H-binding protein [Pantoea sp. JGM49]|uniref:NAD(P)-dependent oxidoreductase n=1 Tax=Pantoea sp. JGM49 TaxID=2799791 RepID=UPI001BACF01A|nr:NAD(P)H-binding protein [Pantoea sp. JGM49]MBS0883848.1 NAD(P)H-binding protein [Pantoea sp. JGM49]